MHSLQCQCDHILEIEVSELIDLDAKADTLISLRDGSFLSYTCERCGSTLRPEASMSLRGGPFTKPVYLVAESERMTVIREKFDSPAGAEILVGIPELIERIHIVDSTLDVKAIEVLKYYLQGKAEENEPDADINVYFGSIVDGKLQFRISGFKSGDTGLVNIPMAKYEEIRADLPSISRKAPFKAIFHGAYQSFRKAAFLDDAKR